MSLIRLLFCGSIILLQAGAVSAVTWNVEQIGGCSDSSCNPCCTIQGAVAKSVGGDVISVLPGTYPEQVDFRGMQSVGDITLEAASGPGTVLVSPATGHTLRHGGSHTNTVTIDGVDFTSAGTSACVYLDHQGDVVLTDVTANNCGYTAFVLDNPGSVTMDGCTANNNGRYGIAVDGAANAALTDCSANSNPDSGIVVYTLGTLDIFNATAEGNTIDGISVDTNGAGTVTGATITGSGRVGLNVGASGSVSILDSTITGNADNGIYLEQLGPGPVTSVTLTNTDVSNNGHGAGAIGVKLRDVEGPVVVTNCSFDNNADDGFLAEDSVIGDLEIYGGHANGNGDDGFDLHAIGNATVIGAVASGNSNYGFELDMPGTVFFQDCVANNNLDGGGFEFYWQDPDPIDAISVIDCIANNNGLSGGGEGVSISNVAGPVTVVGTQAIGNADAGIAIREANNTVLIRNVTSLSNGEDGIKLDVGGGPISVLDSLVDSSVGAGIAIAYGGVDIENLLIRRNAITGNGTNGIEFYDVGGPGPFVTTCNDIVGNPTGLYLSDSVTVDARKVWWGDPTGPSGQGPGAGDPIYADPGGTIIFNPWLTDSFISPLTTCELFGSGFETGLVEEWDVVVE